MCVEGNPGALLAWPAAYAYLAWLGWTNREDSELSEVISVTTLPQAPTEEKTRLFSRNRVETGLKPNAQESAIINRIHTWEVNAADRKLHEVFPGSPVIDESGILIPMEFAGLWTPSKLDNQVDQLRALPYHEQITQHFCIQGWSGVAKWGGVSMRSILELVQPKPEAKWVIFCGRPSSAT